MSALFRSRQCQYPIVFLLPLWGKKHIEQFFHFALPSLLTPGNIPSLVDEYLCTFLFLTTEETIPYIKKEAIFQSLASYCEVEFLDISDIIFEGIHTATITIAYDRGMRSRQKNMCSTYFFFLVSDCIAANNSFFNIKKYLEAGYRGITIGVFRVLQESISPLLEEIIEKSNDGTLNLSSRSLLSLAFNHLHPHTLAETVTELCMHAEFANRLFWKVNDKMLIGHFYVRHMLCIKPEVSNYIIGSSCDYSFIVEMCPSGHVKHIQDSDDFCMVEVTPSSHDTRYIRKGAFDIKILAAELSILTNSAHRSNAHIPVFYHCEDLIESSHEDVKASADFICSLEKLLSHKIQPVFGHYFWLSALDCILKIMAEKKEQSRYYCPIHRTFAGIIGSSTFAPVFSNQLDDRPLLTLFDRSLLPRSAKKNLDKMLRGFSPRLHWIEEIYLSKSFWKLQNPLDSCFFLLAFEPIKNSIYRLERFFPLKFSYLYYNFLKVRCQSDLEAIFCNKRPFIILLTQNHFAELSEAIKLCAHYLPKGNIFLIYLKHSYTDSIVVEKINSLIESLRDYRIDLKKMYTGNHLTFIYIWHAIMRCLKNIFYPGKSMSFRQKNFLKCIFYFKCFQKSIYKCFKLKSKRKSRRTIIFLKSF